MLSAGAPITGVITVDPDKSITHRALFFAAVNRGITVVRNPSRAADPLSTLGLLREVGYKIEEQDDDSWIMQGKGMPEPGGSGDITLDCGNSGTTARLAAGFLTGEHGTFRLVGDSSLMRRPMERVAEPVAQLGAIIQTTSGRLPLVIRAEGMIPGLKTDEIEVSSAQVHGALVLAALRSEHGAAIRRARPMRDHTVRLARRFGVNIAGQDGQGIDRIAPSVIDLHAELRIPGDLSSAAFMIAAALLVPGSKLRIEDVGLNPTRTAFLDCLAAMSANVRWEITRDEFEPVGWIESEYSPELRGITLGLARPEIPVAEMMDELPLLALLATQAHGRTIVNDAAELRVKESDRISATAQLLASLGLKMQELEDGFAIEGPQPVAGGAQAGHHDDHRLCMAAAVAALIAREPVTIPSPEIAAVSYPGFWRDLGKVAEGCVRVVPG